ncbi:MAG TPA: DUF3347 domain-containing protein [Chitinophagales bacterium]|nr:DUF3347 domain-containing protein [Chitinophagales bacterium]
MKTQLLSIVLALIMGSGATAQTSAKESNQTKMPDYLTAYLQLKDALHEDDAAKAKIAAADMKTKITNAGIDDQKKVESINEALKTITENDDIEAQRTAFAKLSQYMITILENNPVPGVALYSDYCHMARNGKGAYWISADKEINNNPYMGGKMPHCGTVDEKISK